MPDRPLRLFVALMLPDDVQDRIRSVVRSWPELRKQFRGRPASEYHFTLKFLGDVARDDAERVADALEPAFDGMRAFDVALGRLGAFPNAGRASVLWWGVDDGADELRECARRVEDALGPLGFDREKRSYKPHVTLARFRPPAKLGDWVEEANGSPAVAGSALRFEASHVSLVRSELSRQGARYSEVCAISMDAD
jgi:RNA 2',3'-cyclic 3'-phosphodiesterase